MSILRRIFPILLTAALLCACVQMPNTPQDVLPATTPQTTAAPAATPETSPTPPPEPPEPPEPLGLLFDESAFFNSFWYSPFNSAYE